MAKARQGVRVYFLYDEVGSNDLPRSTRRSFAAAGAEVCEFHTQKGPGNRFQLNFRNHRKIVVVDGREAWIGGTTWATSTWVRDAKFGNWRDTHVRIQGPAALAAQLSFLGRLVLGHRPGARSELDAGTVAETATPGCSITPTGPADELETAALMFMHAINSARERLWIASPYFVPDEACDVCPALAALRGVDVRILIPDMPDHLAGLPGRLLLLRRGRADGCQVLPLHGWLPAPEGDARSTMWRHRSVRRTSTIVRSG